MIRVRAGLVKNTKNAAATRDQMELKVEKLLKDKQIEYQIIKLSQDAYTVSDVMKFSNGDVNADEICKTMVLAGKESGKMVGESQEGQGAAFYLALPHDC